MSTTDVTFTVWDDPRNVETLRSMYADGASHSEIALTIGQGVTRNAVAGKINRLKLPKRAADVRVRPSAQHGNKGQTNGAAIAHRRRGANGLNGLGFKMAEARKQGLSLAEGMHHVLGRRTGGPLPEEDGGVDVTHLVGIMDLNAHTCRYPQGDPLEPGFKFCGREPLPDKPYCEEHDRRTHTRL